MDENNPNMNEQASQPMPAPVTEPMSQPGTPISPMGGKLPGIMTLVENSWNLYAARFKTSVLLQLLSIIVIIIAAVLFGGVGFGTFALVDNLVGQIFGGLVVAFFFAILILIYLWITAAQMLVYHLEQSEVSVKKVLNAAKPVLKPLFIVFILQALVNFTGFILLIIPGLIFTFLFTFSTYIAVIEKRQWFDALLASREYVRGYFWPVVFRILLMAVSVIILSIILGGIGGNGVNFVYNLLVTPLIVAYVYSLYTQLKTIKGDIVLPENWRTPLKVLAVLGIVLMAAAIIGLIAFAATYKGDLGKEFGPLPNPNLNEEQFDVDSIPTQEELDAIQMENTYPIVDPNLPIEQP